MLRLEFCVARVVVLCALSSQLLSPPLLPAAEAAHASRVRDVVLERAVATENVSVLDLNTDGAVDVADAVRRVRSLDVNSNGLWLVVLSLNNVADQIMSASISYPVYFTLQKQTESTFRGVVCKARGFDPTKNIMDQIGANQAQRPTYEPSCWIPLGWPVNATFDKNTESVQISLASIPIDGSQTNTGNPFPVFFMRGIQASFNGVPAPGEMMDGVATETTFGLRAGGQPIVLNGVATLFYCGNDPAVLTNQQLVPLSTRSTSSPRSVANTFSVSAASGGKEESVAEPNAYLTQVSLSTGLAISHPSQDTVFASSWYDNMLCPAGAAWNPQSVFLGGGGQVYSGAAGESNVNAGTVLSLGQPFAGSSFLVDADSLRMTADELLTRSTLFYVNENVIRGTSTNLNPADFNVTDLYQAERYYVALTAARPYVDDGVTGTLECRIRMAVAYNLLSDYKMLDLYKYKFTAATNLVGDAILRQETNLLWQAASNASLSAQATLSLYADPQFRSVGAFMRREVLPAINSPLELKMAEAVRVTAESVRRFAEIRLKLAEKKVILGFFQSGQRNLALHELVDLQAWLTEALRVIAACTDTTDFDTTGVRMLSSCLEQTKKLESDIRAGYNHLGFHPDFVPFLGNNDINNQQGTVQKIKQWFEQSVLPAARTAEQDSENAGSKFTSDWATYQKRVSDIKNSGNDRLKALCGVIENPNPGSGQPQYEPDIYTFMLSDTTQRTDMLGELLPGWTAKSFGQIAIQFQNIANAQARIEQAMNDIRNLVEEMEIHDQTAQTIASNMTVVAELILANGQRMAFLTRQKGLLRQQAAIDQANATWQNSLLGMEEKYHDRIMGPFNNSPLKYCYPQLVLAEMSYYRLRPQPPSKGLGKSKGFAAVAQAGTMLAQDYLNSKNVMDQAKISGQLAMAEAGIDGQMQEIQAIERAEVQYSAVRDLLARNEEQLKVLALRQANLGLAIQIAQRDAIKEEMQLANMIGEVVSLMSEVSRSLGQEAELQNNSWCKDWRAVYYASQADAEAYLHWAQAGCYMLLRATDFYLNQSSSLQEAYNKLYCARRVKDLQDVLLIVDQKLLLQLDTTAKYLAVLSLKYDILSRQFCTMDTNGNPINTAGSTSFSYTDRVNGQVLSGALAYQARLRDFLKQHLRQEGDHYVLEFEFATDLIPVTTVKRLPDGTPLPYRQNPFWISASIANQVVLSTSLSPSLGGIMINLTGTSLPNYGERLIVNLAMTGNMYQRKSYTANDPTAGIVAYSSYKQRFPNGLKLFSDTAEPDMQTFTSERTASFVCWVNDASPPNTDPAINSFTERAVACDRWVFTMRSGTMGGYSNWELLDTLYQRVNQPASEFNYVKDLQFRVGWVGKNIQ